MWGKETIWYIMTAAIILHNMIIENERGLRKRILTMNKMVEEYQRRDSLLWGEFLRIHNEIENRTMLEKLRDDLVEHFWTCHGVS